MFNFEFIFFVLISSQFYSFKSEIENSKFEIKNTNFVGNE